MCGLFACFSTADKIRNLSFDVVNSCLESLEHRGPDNKGVAFITKSDVINFPFLSDQKNFEYKIPTGALPQPCRTYRTPICAAISPLPCAIRLRL